MKDRGIEDEQRHDGPSRCGSLGQRGMIVKAKVAPQPDDDRTVARHRVVVVIASISRGMASSMRSGRPERAEVIPDRLRRRAADRHESRASAYKLPHEHHFAAPTHHRAPTTGDDDGARIGYRGMV